MVNKLMPVLVLSLAGILFLSMTVNNAMIQDPWEVPAEYQNMENPYAGVKDRDKIGFDTYAMYCQSCHGKKGLGDGINSKLLETPVASFTEQNFKAQTDGSLYYKIYTGRNEMPSFERIITEEEDLWLLVNYIKSL